METSIKWAGPINHTALEAAIRAAGVPGFTGLACWHGVYIPNPENEGKPGLISVTSEDGSPDPTGQIAALLVMHDPVFMTIERDAIRVGELCKVEVYAPLKDGAAVNLKIADSVIGVPLRKGRGVLILRGDDPCDIEISLKNGSNRNVDTYQLRITT